MQLLTSKEVAKMLHASVATVHRLADSGKLRCVNIGTGRFAVRRFDPAALDEFLNQSPPRPPAPVRRAALPPGILQIV